MNKASHMMTDWFPYLFFLVCLVVTRRVYLTWAWGESCHKTLVLLVFAQISIQFSSVLSLNAHGNPARLFPPSTPHQGGDLVGYQVKTSKCSFRTFLLYENLFFFCNFVQDYSQLLRDILGGTKGHPLVARIL